MRTVKVSWRFFFYNNYLLHFLLIEGCSFIDCLQSASILNNKIIIIISLKIQSPLPKTDTFGTGTKCPSKRDVRLIESQVKTVKKGRDQL